MSETKNRLNVDELASRLGVSRVTTFRLKREGKLPEPEARADSKLLWLVETVEKWEATNQLLQDQLACLREVVQIPRLPPELLSFATRLIAFGELQRYTTTSRAMFLAKCFSTFEDEKFAFRQSAQARQRYQECDQALRCLLGEDVSLEAVAKLIGGVFQRGK